VSELASQPGVCGGVFGSDEGCPAFEVNLTDAMTSSDGVQLFRQEYGGRQALIYAYYTFHSPSVILVARLALNEGTELSRKSPSTGGIEKSATDVEKAHRRISPKAH
jgi:hypothetical protein